MKNKRISLSIKLILPIALCGLAIALVTYFFLSKEISTFINNEIKNHAYEYIDSFTLATETNGSKSNLIRVTNSLGSYASVSDIYLIDSANNTILSSNHNKYSGQQYTTINNHNLLLAIKKFTSNYKDIFQQVNNETFIIISRTRIVAEDKRSVKDMILAIKLNTNSISPYMQTLQHHILLLTFLAFTLSFILFYLIANKILVTPIKNIANSISLGIETKRPVLSLHKSGDELGILSETYNNLIKEYFNNRCLLLNAKKDSEMATKAKSQFLATMSHEIRTPMNGVLGIAQLLEKTPLDGRQKNYIKTIKSSGTALLTVIDDILTLSKIESGNYEIHIEKVNLLELIEQIISLFKTSQQSNNIELHYQICETCSQNVKADPNRIRQILVNLIGNALKFTKEGSININITCALEKDVEFIKFSVIDTGIGLTEQQIKKLFKPFSQADSSTTRKYGGTGLGLSICKQLTILMGGKIGVESIYGKGSKFWFTLPAEASTSSNTQEESPTSRPSNIADLEILIVDDTEFNLVIASCLLEEFGCKATTVQSGAEAIKKITEKKFDIILMDCLMPDKDGYETTKNIREIEINLKTHTPIIALTADVNTTAKNKCIASGMDDYLTKPLIEDELVAMLHKWANTDLIKKQA